MLYLAVFILLVAAAYLFLIAPGEKRMPDEIFRGNYAHRGLWDRDVPENSLPAFRAAGEHGFGVELDVHLTADGETVVIHDDNLKRMCGVDKKVCECTLKELQSFRLMETEETVPTFGQVLEAAGGDTPLIVEIKHDRRRDMICRKTIAQLERRKGPFCVESFDPLIVRWFRKHKKKVFRGQLAYGLNVPGRYPLNTKNLFLSSLIVNVLGRPDFVAFDHHCSRSVPFRLMKRLFHPSLAAWTVRRGENVAPGEWNMLIFEGFIPDETFCLPGRDRATPKK